VKKTAPRKKKVARKKAPSKHRSLQSWRIPDDSVNQYIDLRVEAEEEIAALEVKLRTTKTLYQERLGAALEDLRAAAHVPYEEGMQVGLQGNRFVEQPEK
jgi:hypothetical protein